MSSVRNDVIDGLNTVIVASNLFTTNSSFEEASGRLSRHKLPILMAIDTGEDQINVQDGSDMQLSFPFILRMRVTAGNRDSLHEKLNIAIDQVRQLVIDTEASDISGYARNWQYVRTETNRFEPGASTPLAESEIETRVTYIRSKVSS